MSSVPTAQIRNEAVVSPIDHFGVGMPELPGDRGRALAEPADRAPDANQLPLPVDVVPPETDLLPRAEPVEESHTKVVAIVFVIEARGLLLAREVDLFT
jgi:hypothetical protein